MKLIDKITYFAFGINIAAIFFYFVGLPVILMTEPDAFYKIATNKGINPYNITLIFVSVIVFFHWTYCIWFLFKYDRYSKSLFLLFFLNALYAPIYFYRVRIKKRPLRNKINIPHDIITEEKRISDQEFVDMNRQNVFGVIDLWASKESQFDFQKNAPNSQVTAELFYQWGDFYLPASDDFKESFNKEELEILAEFDMALNKIIYKPLLNLSVIEEFVMTEEWKKMNEHALLITKKINRVHNK